MTKGLSIYYDNVKYNLDEQDKGSKTPHSDIDNRSDTKSSIKVQPGYKTALWKSHSDTNPPKGSIIFENHKDEPNSVDMTTKGDLFYTPSVYPPRTTEHLNNQ